MLFLDSLIDKIFVPCGISEERPFDFSNLVGAEINSFMANLKQDSSFSKLQVRLTGYKLPELSIKNILISCSFNLITGVVVSFSFEASTGLYDDVLFFSEIDSKKLLFL